MIRNYCVEINGILSLIATIYPGSVEKYNLLWYFLKYMQSIVFWNICNQLSRFSVLYRKWIRNYCIDFPFFIENGYESIVSIDDMLLPIQFAVIFFIKYTRINWYDFPFFIENDAKLLCRNQWYIVADSNNISEISWKNTIQFDVIFFIKYARNN